MAKKSLSGHDFKAPVLLDGSAGSPGQVLASQGSGLNPIWIDPASGPEGPPGPQGEPASFAIGTQPPTEGLLDGSVWLDTDGEVLSATVDLVRWIKIASQDQTIFSGAAEYTGSTLGYIPNNEQVFLNGVQLVRSLDYSASDGSTISLSVSASAGDILQVITLPSVLVDSSINKNIIEAKGDLLVGLDTNTPSRIAIGANETFLKADSSAPLGVSWSPIDTTAAEENYIIYIMGA